MSMLDITLRSVVSVAVLFLLTRLMGRKQISQLTFFDYAIGISIGSIAGEMAFSHELPYLEAILAMVIYAAFSILISFGTIKSMRLRKFFTGLPTVLIQNGEILEENLKKVKYDVNDLLTQARSQGYFDLSDIAFAVMESNGQLTVLPTGEQKPVVAGDLGIPTEPASLTANLIIDGHIIREHLRAIGKEEQWLQAQLKEQGAPPVKEILLATCDGKGEVTVYQKNAKVKEQKVLG